MSKASNSSFINLTGVRKPRSKGVKSTFVNLVVFEVN